MFFLESGKARKKSGTERTGLQSCSQYTHVVLHTTLNKWNQFLEVEGEAEDRYDLVNGILLSHVSMTKDDG